MALQNDTQEGRIHARTTTSAYEGSLVLPGAVRFKEFINRPSPTMTLTDAEVTTSPPGAVGSVERVPSVTIYKSHILYATLVDEIRRARARVYERDVLAAHLRKELFSFQLDGGIVVTGEVVGGEHSIVFLKGAFLAIANPTVANLRGADLLGALSFVLINVGRIEHYRSIGGGASAPVLHEEAEERAEEPPPVQRAPSEMDFSDFEAQFVRIDRLDAKPSP